MILGYLSALVSAVAISVSSLAAKQALKKEHSLDFSIFAHILGLIFLLPVLFLNKLEISSYYLGLIYVASFLGAFGFYFTMRAMRHIDISLEAPIFNFSIVFTAVLGYLILGESLSFNDLVGVVFIFLGVFFIEVKSGLGAFLEAIKKSKYIHFLLLGVFAYSLGAILDRTILKEVGIWQYLLVVYFFLTINYLAIWLLFHRKEIAVSVALKEAKESFGWLMLFTVTRLVSNFFFAYALTVLYAGVAMAIKRFSVVITVFLGGKFLHEKDFNWRMFSSLVILVGVIFMMV